MGCDSACCHPERSEGPLPGTSKGPSLRWDDIVFGIQRRATMTKLLLKSGIVVTQDAKLGVLPNGDVLVEDGRIAAIAPSLQARCRDRRLQRALRAAGPGQRPHAHLADGAALGGRQLDAAGIFPPRPCRARHGVHARGHPYRHAGRRAEPARPWRDHAGRLVPQQPDARAHRCRHRRPEGVAASAPPSSMDRPSPIPSPASRISRRSLTRARKSSGC